MNHEYDAVVVGAGPNGLAAAITLARAKCSVLLIEANGEIGGACRSAELTLPGFTHDVCSAIHPLAVASPFFQSLTLERFGLSWIHPELPLAHPLEGKNGVVLNRSLAAQVSELGKDGRAYERLIKPFVAEWEKLELLKPLLRFPNHAMLSARFGLGALQSAARLTRRFQNEPAKALFGGLAAHSFLSLDETASAAVGMVLGILAHAAGWPMPKGGTGQITRALGEYFRELGGKIVTGQRVASLDELPPSRAIILDLTARQVADIAEPRLPERYRRALKKFCYGPAAFKIDYALSSPVPWKYAGCARAGTVHLGGTFAEIEESERQVSNGILPKRPFVLVAQPTLFDSTRAPLGKHIVWAYGHVPHVCDADVSGAIEEQIERFAPGFRDCVIARAVRGPKMLERDNANLVGGDINGGLANLRQTVARPALSLDPYKTPAKGLYICSASTPPGGGVHGMCGYNAALTCLRHEFKIILPDPVQNTNHPE